MRVGETTEKRSQEGYNKIQLPSHCVGTFYVCYNLKLKEFQPNASQFKANALHCNYTTGVIMKCMILQTRNKTHGVKKLQSAIAKCQI